MIALITLALLQAPAPTVGDTVWAVRAVVVRAGAVVRPMPWPDDADRQVQSLGAPQLARRGDTVEIRYPLVAWAPGEHPIEIPGVILLGPGAAIDSLPVEPSALFIESVIPDSVDTDSVASQPPASTVGRTERSLLPVLQFSLLGVALGASALLVGRRRPRGEDHPPTPRPSMPDLRRWAGAGELRAAEGGALARLRQTIAKAVPAAGPGLDTAACLARLREVRSDWPLLELEGLLLALEAERFSPGEGDPDLVERAESLRARLERAG
jgi:hypothetical protein